MFKKRKKESISGQDKRKRSFFEKLTGSVNLDDEFIEDEDSFFEDNENNNYYQQNNFVETEEEENLDGELAVDVLNTNDSIIVKAMIAGVRPNDVDIDISRDMITIRAKREDEHTTRGSDYFQKELFWGSFSRNILLPEEIDVDQAEAKEKNGLLIINLPKIDKNKKTKLQVRG